MSSASPVRSSRPASESPRGAPRRESSEDLRPAAELSQEMEDQRRPKRSREEGPSAPPGERRRAEGRRPKKAAKGKVVVRIKRERPEEEPAKPEDRELDLRDFEKKILPRTKAQRRQLEEEVKEKATEAVLAPPKATVEQEPEAVRERTRPRPASHLRRLVEPGPPRCYVAVAQVGPLPLPQRVVLSFEAGVPNVISKKLAEHLALPVEPLRRQDKVELTLFTGEKAKTCGRCVNRAALSTHTMGLFTTFLVVEEECELILGPTFCGPLGLKEWNSRTIVWDRGCNPGAWVHPRCLDRDMA